MGGSYPDVPEKCMVVQLAIAVLAFVANFIFSSI
jgi:hypothetical protein